MQGILLLSKTSSFSINLQSDADSAIPFAIVLTVVIILVSAFALIFGRKHIKKYIGMIHFKDNEFDLAMSMALLEHIEEEQLETVIKEMARVSKRGFHNVPFVHEPSDHDSTHCTFRPKEWWLKTFEKASKEAKIIKIADRLDNLMDLPTESWDIKRQKSYAEQAKIILDKCGSANEEIALKLKEEIEKNLSL